MKTMRVRLVFALILSGILAACTPASSQQTVSTAGPTEVPATVAVSEAALGNDPQNATYLIEGEAVPLVNGMAEKELAPGSASKQLTKYFGNEVEADLNSDGLMDTGFLLTQEGGGSGTFFYVAALISAAEGYQGTNAVFLGDRIAPQSTNIDPANPSQFIVNYADRKPGEPMSSRPRVGVSKTFKLENGSLVEVPAPPQ